MIDEKLVLDFHNSALPQRGFFEVEALLGLLLLFCILGVVQESWYTMRSINEFRRTEQCLDRIVPASYRALIATNGPREVQEHCDRGRIALSSSCREYSDTPRTAKCNVTFQATQYPTEQFARNLNRMSSRLRESYHKLP